MIENCIEQYLLQHHFCPLPDVGTLQLSKKNAELVRSENLISAPVMFVDFTSELRTADAFIGSIAKMTHSEFDESAQLLRDFCSQLLVMKQGEEHAVSHAGKFMVNEHGKLQFISFQMPSVFLPATPAIRVIHPNSVHQVRVGDNEHTSTYMTELLNDNAKGNGWKWAIAAACIAIVALSIVVFQLFIQHGDTGNAMPIDAQMPTATYQLAQ